MCGVVSRKEGALVPRSWKPIQGGWFPALSVDEIYSATYFPNLLPSGRSRRHRPGFARFRLGRSRHQYDIGSLAHVAPCMNDFRSKMGWDHRRHIRVPVGDTP